MNELPLIFRLFDELNQARIEGREMRELTSIEKGYLFGAGFVFLDQHDWEKEIENYFEEYCNENIPNISL